MSEVCFKDSGIEWIGEIPKHWEIGKVKHYYKMTTGFTPSSDNEFFYDDENGHIWVTISDLKEKYIADSSSKISQFYVEQYKPKKTPKNSLLYSFKLSVGEVAFNKVDVFTNEAIASFFDNDNISLPFLYYSSRLIIFNANENIYGAKILNQELIKNAKIVFPPLQEQEAIARYLDEKTQAIDELIATHQKSIEKLKNYRISLISEVVTQGLDKNAKLKDSGIEWIGEIPEHWGTIKIGLAFEKIGSGTTPQSDNETYYDGDIPWVNSGDLNDSVLIETAKKVTLRALNDYSALKIYPRHTLVIAMYGATIGKVSLLGIDACVNQACCTLNCSSFFEQKFVFYWFLGNRQNIINLGIGGGQQNISQDIIKKIKIPLPPLQEQEAIAHYLDEKTQAIDELISTHQKSIEKLKNYRTSLISEAVMGKNLKGMNNGN